MKRLAIAFCLACSAASAAIVSEENDLYTVVPRFFTLYGSPSKPGIRSPFIPYGTYTDGYGSTEYLRVTTNLVGVLYSTVDGYWERYHIPLGVRPVDMPSYTRYYPTTDTNETRRIIDILNATNYVYRTGLYDEDYAYHTVRGAGTLEYRLAHAGSFRHEGLAAGFGGRYLDELTGNALPPISTEWSTTYPFLESATNAWHNVFPTYAGLSCDDHVWPSNEYGNVHTFARGWEDQWMYPSHLADIWANGWSYSDLRSEAEFLRDALHYTPLPYMIEDVLGRDTGWKYPVRVTNDYWIVTGPYIGGITCKRISGDFEDDESYKLWAISTAGIYAEVMYRGGSQWTFVVSGRAVNFHESKTAGPSLTEFTYGNYTAKKVSLYEGEDIYTHWKNGSTRLDWTRLGIICQLERHMETTYRAREREDLALPLNEHWSKHSKTYVAAPTTVSFVLSNTMDRAVAVLQDDPSSWAWTLAANEVICITNFCGHSFPSARMDRPDANWTVNGSAISYPLTISQSDVASEVLSVAYMFRDIGCAKGSFTITYEISSGFSSYWDGWGQYWHFKPVDWVYTDDDTGEMTQASYYGGWSKKIPDGTYVCTNYLSWAKVLSKTANVWATDDAAASNIFANLSWESPAWPAPAVFSNRWVSSVSVPNVEVMQSVTNDGYWISSTLDPMEWSVLRDRFYFTNGYEQVYRLEPASCTTEFRSFASLENGRRASLAGLNYEVLRKFSSITGQNAPDAALQLCQLGADEAKMEQAAANAEYSSAVILQMNGEKAYITGDSSGKLISFELEDADGQRWRIYPNADGDYRIGSLVFNVSAGGGFSCTDSMPCRVDGHQNQLIKTLWKFRNLRDKNL